MHHNFIDDKGTESHPHCDADGAVHVALVQPAVLGDASFVGAKRGRILAGVKTHSDTI